MVLAKQFTLHYYEQPLFSSIQESFHSVTLENGNWQNEVFHCRRSKSRSNQLVELLPLLSSSSFSFPHSLPVNLLPSPPVSVTPLPAPLISAPYSQTLTLVILSQIHWRQSCDLSCERRGRLASGIPTEGTFSLCIPPLARFGCLLKSDSSPSPPPQSFSSKLISYVTGLNVFWEQGGQVLNPRLKWF